MKQEENSKLGARAPSATVTAVRPSVSRGLSLAVGGRERRVEEDLASALVEQHRGICAVIAPPRLRSFLSYRVFACPLRGAPCGGAGRHQRIAALDQGNRGPQDKKSELGGRQIALIAMAVYADQRAVAASSRSWHQLDCQRRWAEDIGGLLDELVTDTLPDQAVSLLASVLEERRQLRAQCGVERRGA